VAARKQSKKRKKLKRTRTTDPAQSARFLEMARRLEVDDSLAAFDRAMDAIVPKKKR